MNIKVLLFLIFNLTLICAEDQQNISNDKIKRQSDLSVEGWSLIKLWDFEKSYYLGDWNDTNIVIGGGLIEVKNSIITFGGSKFGGYIWIPIEMNEEYGKKYMLIFKLKSSNSNGCVWIKSKSVLKKKEIKEFNNWVIESLDYEINNTETTIKSLLCIGYLESPIVTKMQYQAGEEFYIWEKCYIDLDWVELWWKK